jgi:hypothetical protein
MCVPQVFQLRSLIIGNGRENFTPISYNKKYN